MKIYNANVFIDGKFVSGGVEYDEKIISCGEAIKDGDIDAGGNYLIPGLVDIHSHAAMNEDASDGRAEGIPVMSRYYASRGVTSWCPTTMTLSEETLTAAVKVIKDFVRPEDGAKVAGINLEGPFLSTAKKGAQAEEFLRAPDADMFKRLNDASGGIVKLITIAPEEPSSIPFIKEVSKYCAVSLGHTTADYDTAKAAYDAGASHATHLYNAMPSLLHRAPGVIGAAFDCGATVELICDGFHIHPSVVRLTWEVFKERMVLISDSMRCAGMPDGEYTLGGQPVTVKGGKATLTGTDTIAGSSIHLMDGVQRSVKFGIPLEKAVTAATIAPAKVIKMDDQIGSIAAGKCADFVIMDKDLNVKEVYIEGRKIK